MRLWRAALLQLVTELRFGIRDPHILGYTVWMPLFLYPVLIFVMFQVLAVREGRAQVQRFTIAVPPASQLPAAAPDGPDAAEVLARLRTMARVSIVVAGDVPHGQAAREDYLKRQALDGLVVFRQAGNELTIELHHRGVAGNTALVKRFEAAVEKYRTFFGRRTLRRAGLVVVPLSVDYVNIASSRDMGEFILARLLPITLVIFLGTGAFYTAIDVTAGERERGTLETTLLLPSPRAAIVLGKLGYVMAMAMVSALVNFLSLSLTLGHAFSLLGQGLEIRVTLPPAAIAMVLGSLVVLALAICPLMMGLAFLTKSFREGQSYVGPVYALLIAPLVVASLPGMKLDLRMAFVPMLNLTLGLREIIEGQPAGLPFAVAVLETLAIGALFIAASTRILGKEEAVLGGGEGGSLVKALRRALAPSPRAA